MVHQPIVQTDVWKTYIVIFLVIDSFQDSQTFLGHHTRLILTHLWPYYFLWDYLKERIYNNNPKTLEALEGKIKTEIRGIPAGMIGRDIDNFNARVGELFVRKVPGSKQLYRPPQLQNLISRLAGIFW